MPTRVEGTYRNGHVELAERPDMPDETHVIVVFPDLSTIDLRERGIDEREALQMRTALNAFAEEWDSPEMDAYDDYDRSADQASQ